MFRLASCVFAAEAVVLGDSVVPDELLRDVHVSSHGNALLQTSVRHSTAAAVQPLKDRHRSHNRKTAIRSERSRKFSLSSIRGAALDSQSLSEENTVQQSGSVFDNSEAGTLDRMIYANPHVAGPALNPTNRYFLYNHDQGGLNNIRIGWEMAGLLAQRTGRTLVLPPTTHFYLLEDNDQSRVERYIELARLKSLVPTLTFEEFYQREHNNLNIPSTFADDEHWTTRGQQGERDWKAWAYQNLPKVAGGDPCDLSRYDNFANNILYQTELESDSQKGRLFGCGDWAAIGQPRFTLTAHTTALAPTPPEAWALLRNGFTWHPDCFLFASKIVHHLGLFNYVALHAR